MINIVPYQENWPHQFQKERERLVEAFKGLIIQFHHIGSTSIPGCRAKPIIDILGVTPDITEMDSYNTELEKLEFVSMGEFGVKQRRFFLKKDAVHLHIFEDSDPEVCRHLRFLAYLNAHPELVEAYGDLKERNAKQYPDDRVRYILGKEQWIKEIDILAIKERTPPVSYPYLGPRKKKWNREQILNALHVNLHLFATYFSKFHPMIQLIFQPDITVVQSNIQDDTYNYVISTQFTKENASERIEEVMSLYNEKGLPFFWWVSEVCDTPSDLKSILKTKGLSQFSVETGMYLELYDYAYPHEDATIRRVEINTLLEDFVKVLVSVEGHSEVYKKIYDDLPLGLIQEGTPFEFYLLYEESQPVVSGLVIFHANVAGIYYIYTHPNHRRKGLATKMTHYLLSRARAKGYWIATLQATEMGKSLFQRLGFTEICLFYEYL